MKPILKYKTMKTTYYENQVNRAEEGHDWTYKMTIQIHGTKNKSHYIDISKEQLEAIKQILNKGE